MITYHELNFDDAKNNDDIENQYQYSWQSKRQHQKEKVGYCKRFGVPDDLK